MKPNKEQLALKMAESIRKQRKSLGLTQEQLGEFAGCGVAFIYLLERGKHTVRLDKLLDVLNVLGLQLRLELGKDGFAIDSRLT